VSNTAAYKPVIGNEMVFDLERRMAVIWRYFTAFDSVGGQSRHSS